QRRRSRRKALRDRWIRQTAQTAGEEAQAEPPPRWPLDAPALETAPSTILAPQPAEKPLTKARTIGRPPIPLLPEQRANVLELIELFPSRAVACVEAGVRYAVFRRVYGQDPEFRAEVLAREQARREKHAVVEVIRVTGGRPRAIRDPGERAAR